MRIGRTACIAGEKRLDQKAAEDDEESHIGPADSSPERNTSSGSGAQDVYRYIHWWVSLWLGRRSRLDAHPGSVRHRAEWRLLRFSHKHSKIIFGLFSAGYKIRLSGSAIRRGNRSA